MNKNDDEFDSVYDDIRRKSKSSHRAVTAGAVQVTDGLQNGKGGDDEEEGHPVFYKKKNNDDDKEEDSNPRTANSNDELDQLSDDIRRKHESKSSRSVTTTAGAVQVNGPAAVLLNEHDKMQLAMRTSEAFLPGAVHHAPGQDPVRAKQTQSSQLNLFSRLRRNAKDDFRGPSRHRLDDKMMDSTAGASSAVGLEQEPLDDLSSRMNIFKRQNDTMESDELKTKQRRQKMFLLGGVVGLLVIVGIVVGVVVAMNANSSSSSSSSSSNQQGEPPNTTDADKDEQVAAVDFVEKVANCLGNEEYKVSDRLLSFQDTIVTELPEMTGVIESSTRTAARASLCWLADVDDFLLGSEEGSVVIQRFVVGLIYYHFVLDLEAGSMSQLPESNWLQSNSECGWDYVECSVNDAAGGVVDELLLSRLGLGRTIPSELGLLDKLSTLIMDENGLEGKIPSEIWTMEHLETLSLETNSLTGTISSDLRNLPKLRNLNLYNNNEITGTVPDFAGLPNLELLMLQGFGLKGTFPELEGTTNLEWLQFTSVSLQGTIPSHLGSLTKLTNLQLSGLDVDGSIPTEIGMLTELRFLWLSSMASISGSIPTELGQLTHLQDLRLLRMRGLTGTVPSEIGRLTNLASLDLTGTEGLAGAAIPAEVCDLSLDEFDEPCFGCQTNCNCETKCPG